MISKGGRRILLLFALTIAGSLPSPRLGAQPSADPSSLVRQAREARLAEDWYGAIELYLTALERNPAYADAVVGLAESYYTLEEYGQALERVTEARRLRGDDPSLLVMEAYIRIGLGDIPKAAELFKAVLARLPNDLDARFGLALLDLRSGRPTDASARLTETLRISPRNARALLSLALIASDAGRDKEAQTYLESALRYHSQDPRTHYVAARLALQSGQVAQAIVRARMAIDLKAGYTEARRLLASLLLESGDPASAAELMEESISRNRDDALAWYTLGLARARQKQTDPGLYAFEASLALRPDDEIARRAMEDLAIDGLSAEDARRAKIAQDRFARARAFEANREFDRAMSEYRRGLRVDPYSKVGREGYAELLRLRGRPASYLSELEFLKSLDKADTPIQDAIDNYASALEGTVSRSWGLDQLLLTKRPYRLALFSLPSQDAVYHTGASSVLARALRDELARSSRFEVPLSVTEADSFAQAFRAARESGADWFILIQTSETERDLKIAADVYVAKTGNPAASFSAMRSGNDRVSRAVAQMGGLIESAPPLRGTLLRRSGDRVLVDLGKNDGIAQGNVLRVVRKGAASPSPSGIGIEYAPSDIVAEIDVTRTDEEVSEGMIRRVGYLDTSNLGDIVVLKPAEQASDAQGSGKPPSAAGGTPSPTMSSSVPAWPGLFEEVRRLK